MCVCVEANQVKIVEEGGVEALLMLVQSSQNSTILRVASGAIANLAMNGEHFSWWSNSLYDILNPLNLLLRSRTNSEFKLTIVSFLYNACLLECWTCKMQ